MRLERRLPRSALRLAALFYRSRAGVTPPNIRLAVEGDRVELALDEEWLAEHPLTAAALENEAFEWKGLGRQVDRDPGPRARPRRRAACRLNMAAREGQQLRIRLSSSPS